MQIIHQLKRTIKFALIYRMDFLKQKKFTTFSTGYKCSEEKMLAHLVVKAHTVEKGLTMPQKRYNFGQKVICDILSDLKYYATLYNVNEERFIDVIGIIKEYGCWHRRSGIEIKNRAIIEGLNWLEKKFPSIPSLPQAYEITRDNFFKDNKGNFYDLAHSRHSCRNFSGSVLDADLKKALDLAMTAPSTCNRQSVRLHILEKKNTILGIQSGNRGFGHLANKFILITSDLSDWPGEHQRNAPYVDGGIFLMNLLYSLHFYGIAACTLNMYLDTKRTTHMHSDLDVPENEVPIALVAIGIPPTSFDLTRSTRINSQRITTYHKK